MATTTPATQCNTNPLNSKHFHVGSAGHRDMDAACTSDPVLAFLERVRRRELSESEAHRAADLLACMPARERARLKNEAIARHLALGEFFGDQTARGTSICHQPIAKTKLVREAEDLFIVSERQVYKAERRYRRSVEASLFVRVPPPSDLCSGRGY
jgi:hypothetical protein